MSRPAPLLPGPPAPIDPRIRQRRVAVRREQGRRRLRMLVATATSAAVLAGAWGVTRTPLLDIDRVEVTGARHTTAAAVVEAAGLRHGQRMTGVDEERAAAAVARLPWVASAEVWRRWPGTVEVSVAERPPAAAIRAAGGGWVLADGTGRVLAPVPAPPEHLVAVEGIPTRAAPGETLEPAARQALAVALEIPPERARQFRVVARLPDGSVEVRLAPGGLVRLGPPTDVPAKVAAAIAVLDAAPRRGPVVIDVRVPAAPVLTRPGTLP